MEKVKIPEYIALREVSNQLIILNLKDRRFHVIEGGGREILELIENEQKSDISSIITSLVEKYGEEWKEKVEKDVNDFVEKCLELGILQKQTEGR